MSSKLIALMLLACLAMAHAVEEYQDDQSFEKEEKPQKDEKAEKAEETTADEPKMIMEDMNTQTSTALVQNDPDSIKHKGFCHWGVAVWYKPGFTIRCSCMKCVCKPGGLWACAYHFPFCPYYYCGNQIYNPLNQLCCCGKVYNKLRNYACCGYFYYDLRTSKCCNYYSVKPRKANCPRYQI